MLDYFIYLFALLFVIRFFGPLFQLVKLYYLTGKTDLKKYGAGSAWAVVTGSSDGIGKAFAEILAQRGFNIVLIARNAQKLNEVSEGIKSKSSVQTKIVVVDFSKATPQDYTKISESINGLDIGVLVNNVGLSFEYPEFFLDVDKQRLDDLVSINISAQVNTTYTVLPLMLKKGRGLILNISSISGCTPTPLLSVYSASKAFVNTFSQTLYSEYKSKGIHVECLAPAFVVSKLSKRSRPSLTIPTPETYVKSVLAQVGNVPIRAGYFVHDLITYAFDVIPLAFLMQKNKDMHVGIRSAALRKIQKEKSGNQTSKKD